MAVPSAFYDSGLEPDMPRNDDTQVDTAVLEEISEWLSLPIELTAVIMWLYGAAGAGKSVIARAMAEILESRQQLLATFFFSCDDPSRNHIKCAIATLAYNITLSVPESRPLITATIEMDPHIFHRPFKRQLKKLVLEPLQQLSLQGVIYPTVVIIDGLDKCLNHDERTILLRAISIATAQYPSPLKFLITSRPDVLIARIFNATPIKEASILHSLNIPVRKARLDCSISGHAALRQKVMLLWVIGRSCLFWYYHFPVKFIMKDHISHLLIVAWATNFSFSFQSASSDDEPRAERITNMSNYIPSKYLIVNET